MILGIRDMAWIRLYKRTYMAYNSTFSDKKGHFFIGSIVLQWSSANSIEAYKSAAQWIMIHDTACVLFYQRDQADQQGHAMLLGPRFPSYRSNIAGFMGVWNISKFKLISLIALIKEATDRPSDLPTMMSAFRFYAHTLGTLEDDLTVFQTHFYNVFSGRVSSRYCPLQTT